MKWTDWTLSFVILWLGACSGELRAKPQVQCESGADAIGFVCSDGIIGSCAAGSPQFAVCSDVTVCQASWQQAGAYKCSRDDSLGDSGTPLYSGDSSDPSLKPFALRVVTDSNGDGILSPGEEGRLAIELRNAWRNVAREVSGTLSTEQPGVTISDGSKLYFGSIESGDRACGQSIQGYAGTCNETSYFPMITVASNVPVATMVKFDLTVKDGDANTFSLSFTLPLGAIDQTFGVGALTVVQDTNADGVVSPGEKARLRVPIKNGGTSFARGIEATVSTAQAGVTISDGSKLYFGDIDSGATACGSSISGYGGDCSGSSDSYLLELQVASNVPVTTIVQLKLVLRDAASNSFTLTVELPLGAIDQAFSVSTITIVQDSNADGALSPGEKAQLRVPVTNSGTSDALGLVGSVSSNQPGVTITDGSKLYFGEIQSGATACGSSISGYGGECSSNNSYLLTLQIAANVPVATTIPFELSLRDAAANVFPLNFSLTLGAIDQTFSVSSVSVVQDSNSDGVVSSGEKASLRIPVRNTGKSDALGVVGTVTTEQLGVTITQGAKLYFGTVESGATVCGSSLSGYAGDCSDTYYALQIAVGAGVAPGTSIAFALDLADSYGNHFDNKFSVITH